MIVSHTYSVAIQLCRCIFLVCFINNFHKDIYQLPAKYFFIFCSHQWRYLVNNHEKRLKKVTAALVVQNTFILTLIIHLFWNPSWFFYRLYHFGTYESSLIFFRTNAAKWSQNSTYKKILQFVSRYWKQSKNCHCKTWINTTTTQFNSLIFYVSSHLRSSSCRSSRW